MQSLVPLRLLLFSKSLLLLDVAELDVYVCFSIAVSLAVAVLLEVAVGH